MRDDANLRCVLERVRLPTYADWCLLSVLSKIPNAFSLFLRSLEDHAFHPAHLRATATLRTATLPSGMSPLSAVVALATVLLLLLQLESCAASTMIASPSQCPWATSIVASDSGYVYVACQGAGFFSISNHSVPVVQLLFSCPYEEPQSGVLGIAVASAAGMDTVFLTCPTSSSGLVVSVRQSVATVLPATPLCSYPQGLAMASNGTLYVACQGGSAVVALFNNVFTALPFAGQCSALSLLDQTLWANCNGAPVRCTSNGCESYLPVGSACANGYSMAIGSQQDVVFQGCESPQGAALVAANTTTLVETLLVPGGGTCWGLTTVSLPGEPEQLVATCDAAAGGVVLVTMHAVPTVVTLSISAGCVNPLSVHWEPGADELYLACGVNGGVIHSRCQPGEYKDARFSCARCPPGSYQSQSGATACTSCPSGTYNPNYGQSSPASCAQCSSGTHSNASGLTTVDGCQRCLPGTASASPGAAVCPLCAAGSYQPDSGAFVCSQCDAGKYNSNVGSVSSLACRDCPVSAPDSPPGATALVQCTSSVCSDGLLTVPGHAPCSTLCPIGSFCVGGVQTPCAAGSYAAEAGASACTPCGPGMFSATTGSVDAATCQPCPRSTFSQTNVSASCTICPRGFTTDVTGSNAAALCRAMPECIAIGEAGVLVLCPLAASEPVTVDSLLPDGVALLQSRLAANSTQLNAVRSSNSLRLASFAGGDSTLQESGATGARPATSAEDDGVSNRASTILIIVLLLVAFAPWPLYRVVPAWLALRADRFSLSHATAPGMHPKSQPTQLGAVFSWSFACMAALTITLLVTAPNDISSSAVVPPSTTALTGSAAASWQITIRAYSSASSVASSCHLDPVSSQSGFSNPLTVRTLAVPSPGTDGSGSSLCAVAADCVGCRVTTSAPRVNFTFPHDAQLIEWEVWVSAAAPGAWTRLYGVQQQQDLGALLDAEGELHFSIMESYYTDERAALTRTVRQSGFELSFLQYQRVRPQLASAFHGASLVSLSFVFDRATVVFESSVRDKLSVLQLVVVVVSAVVSIFSAFSVLFMMLEKYAVQRWMRWDSGQATNDTVTGRAIIIKHTPDSKRIASDQHAYEVDPIPSVRAAGPMGRTADTVPMASSRNPRIGPSSVIRIHPEPTVHVAGATLLPPSPSGASAARMEDASPRQAGNAEPSPSPPIDRAAPTPAHTPARSIAEDSITLDGETHPLAVEQPSQGASASSVPRVPRTLVLPALTQLRSTSRVIGSSSPAASVHCDSDGTGAVA